MSGGAWPFFSTGSIEDKAGTVLHDSVPLSIFEGGNFAGSSGETREAQAFVSPDVADTLVDSGNLILVGPDGRKYGVESVVHHQVMGYLEVGLRRNTIR